MPHRRGEVTAADVGAVIMPILIATAWGRHGRFVALDYIVNLSSVYEHLPRCLDTQIHLIPTQTDDHHLDAVTDHDGLIFSSSKNQHLQLHSLTFEEDPAKSARH